MGNQASTPEDSLSRDPRSGKRIYNAPQKRSIETQGYYYFNHQRSLRELRTVLQDYLEDASLLQKKQLAPVMAYFKESLRCMQRYHHPCSNKETQPTLPNFTPFPNLPPELQLLIWEAALPGSRIIEVCGNPSILDRPSAARMNQRAVSDVEKVCKNAQKMVKKHYQQIAFVAVLFPTTVSPRLRGRKYYIDTEIDIMYFTRLDLRGVSPPWESDVKLKNIAVSINKLGRRDIWNSEDLGIEELYPDQLRNMPSIRNIIFAGDGELCLKGSSRREFTFDEVLPMKQSPLFDCHPFAAVFRDNILGLWLGLRTEDVATAFKGIEVEFALFRRPKGGKRPE